MSELFLKDEKVLTLKDIEGVPSEIQRVDAPELLPVCLKSNCTMEQLKIWLDRRSIPEKREGLEEVVDKYGKSWLANKNYASLSDQYWIKKRTEVWKNINFFTRIYNKMIGDMFFSPWTIPVQRKYDNNSPDLTTGGVLKKRWLQNADKTSSLVKAGSMEMHQEPLSEVLVSVLAEQLGTIPCVKYDLWVEGVTICSKCDNFITQDTELVPAYMIYEAVEKKDGESTYDHLIRSCEEFDIPDARDFIDWMIFIDNITGNEDRNLNNIGFIRDVKTMKFVGPAPLFDSGNAYWSTKNISDAVKSKMFGDVEQAIFNKMKRQCNLDAVLKMGGFIDIISCYPGITDEKKENLINAIKKRNNRLKDKEMDIFR